MTKFNLPAVKARTAAIVAAPVALLAPLAAHAAIDVSAVTTAIGEAEAPITAIGGAVLAVIVVAYVFKWIRRAF